LIAGYATNIDKTIDPLFKMPTDPKNRSAVSVHYYDPFGFTHLEHDESWATLRMTWGTTADYDELNGYMDKMKTNFVDKGIPVIVGEYGFASNLARDQSEIRKYTLAVAKAIYSRDMCPVLWDIQRDERPDYYNRKTQTFTDPQFVAGIKEIAGNSSSNSTKLATNHSPLATPNSPTYYSLKGKPLGNAKPQKAGVYIVKQGRSIQKIVVK